MGIRCDLEVYPGSQNRVLNPFRNTTCGAQTKRCEIAIQYQTWGGGCRVRNSSVHSQASGATGSSDRLAKQRPIMSNDHLPSVPLGGRGIAGARYGVRSTSFRAPET